MQIFTTLIMVLINLKVTSTGNDFPPRIEPRVKCANNHSTLVDFNQLESSNHLPPLTLTSANKQNIKCNFQHFKYTML